MKKKFATTMLVMGISLILFGGIFSFAMAGETTEAILEILHERGDITDQEYEDLQKKARKEDRGFDTCFDRRLHIDSRNGRVKLQIGGRILIDAVAVDAEKEMDNAADTVGEAFEGTGTEFRQARLHITGVLYDRVAFSNEFDFAGGETTFMENWIELRRVPWVGNMRVGHTKEPFSLERMNSRMYMPFMERALPDGIVPGRNTGLRLLNFLDQPRLSWSFGVFKETGGSGNDFTENGDYNCTGRVTVTPWYAEGGCKLLHLGLGYSHKFASEDRDETWLRFRKRPELHISDFRPADTGLLPADGADMFGPEAALVLGPLCLQAEYWYTRLDSSFHDDPVFNGWYVSASYFLTGEHRAYKQKGNDGAEFSLVDIASPWTAEAGGKGAWQVAARYADLDLNDESVRGGEMSDITLALNWYPCDNLRGSVNYVHIWVEDSAAEAGIADAEADVWQMRWQIYF